MSSAVIVKMSSSEEIKEVFSDAEEQEHDSSNPGNEKLEDASLKENQASITDISRSEDSKDELDNPLESISQDKTELLSNRAPETSPETEGTFPATSGHTVASASSTSQGESGLFGLSDVENDTFFNCFEPIEEIIDPSELLDEGAAQLAFNFATEHRILLRAVLDLLSERDRHAPVVGMMDPIILKSGPLKKASQLMAGTWRVKYVEVRRGMFSYYENAVSKDATGEGELLRKDIPLEANSCRCRAVRLHKKALNLAPGGAIFELTVGGTKRLWLAKSRQERQSWIEAVKNAVVGKSVTRGDSLIDHHGLIRGVSPRSPFKSDLRQYLKTQSILRNVTSKQEYIVGLNELKSHSLKVPVKWIAKQGLLTTDSTEVAFREETVDTSVDQLFKDLQRDSVCINQELFQGDGNHGPERIIGALMREILGVGREGAGRCELTESQVLAYARDILLSGNRTRSGGDSYFCINTLCRNSDLVVVVPSGTVAEPVMIDVSEDDSESSSLHGMGDKSGWIRTRGKLQRTWKKLFFVLSEGTLSYYESAHPRPHGLKGQLVLVDATIAVMKRQRQMDGKASEQYVMTVTTKDGLRERQLLFLSEDRLLDWTYALECVANCRGPARKPLRRQASAADGDTLKSAKKPHRRRTSSAPDEFAMLAGVDLATQITKDHASNVGLDPDAVESRRALHARKTASTLRVSVRASTEYKICTTDPEGDEREDTWATVRTQFLQSFRISGGPNGRLMKGEEVVRVSVVDCLNMEEEVQDELADSAASTPRRARNRRIFRISNPDGEEAQGISD